MSQAAISDLNIGIDKDPKFVKLSKYLSNVLAHIIFSKYLGVLQMVLK